MARKTNEALTPAEWLVMKIVWQHRSCAARDVCAEAGRACGWSASTVKTILRRLVAKGHLTTTQVGNSFLYRPARSALRSLRAAADALLDNAVDGTVGSLLAYMVKRSRLSAAEMAELRCLVDEPGAAAED